MLGRFLGRAEADRAAGWRGTVVGGFREIGVQPVGLSPI